MTILDQRRKELDARIGLLQDEIATLTAKLETLMAERHELDDYVPAVDPDADEDAPED